ncbi:MFS general substrate transporter [Teratosphaeria nubilosa]|uniref:MFS general substrate transporter n=1 Tax=Teratosphaeria nubilosa TaxID=161662 RepID=A0A6G1LAM7_9PEZI|nr:MFS general substrate transporter [Teratosphaeria nubilosa]
MGLPRNSIEEAEDEKRAREDTSSQSGAHEAGTADDEIVWHYLTFETDLPCPAYLSQPPPSPHPPPPQCPDLNQYTSPFLWSPLRKKLFTWLSATSTMLAAYSAGAYTSGEDQMAAHWHVSLVTMTVGVTVFTIGFGVAPMILAPFSEINGRRPMFVVTGVLFVIFQLVCALTPTYAGMIVARFLVGCAGSTFSTMVGGIVSDIYHAKDRNTAMSLFAGGALFGTGLGPVISGLIAQHTTWRWIFYHQVIVDGVVMALVVLFFQETRGSVLLSRKAKALNQWYSTLEAHGHYGVLMPTTSLKPTPQRIRWKVLSDSERASLPHMLKLSLTRPFHLLLTEPVVFFFSLWVSFAWAVLYLLFSAIPYVFDTKHAFTLEQRDAVFTAISVAAILSTILSIYQERIARHYLPPNRQAFLSTPEGRLYFSCVQSLLLPIGWFWFGWTTYSRVPWIVPALAVGCATMGIFSIYLAVFNYLADTYHRYASSALAAQSFCRNMLCGAFPLFTRQMFHTLTDQGAASLLGGIAAVLTVVPWVLVFYGPRVRKRSRFAGELVGEK